VLPIAVRSGALLVLAVPVLVAEGREVELAERLAVGLRGELGDVGVRADRRRALGAERAQRIDVELGDDLGADERWPLYREEALKQTPIRSILSFGMFGDGQTTAALNFYAEPTHAFDDGSVNLGMIFATHTAPVWNMARREQQFRTALVSRDIIGQAKGMLMERFDIDAAAAFGLLTRVSQESNTPVALIAERVIAGDHPRERRS